MSDQEKLSVKQSSLVDGNEKETLSETQDLSDPLERVINNKREKKLE